MFRETNLEGVEEVFDLMLSGASASCNGASQQLQPMLTLGPQPN